MLGDDEKTKMKEDNSEDKKETQTPRKGGKVKFTVTPVHLEDVAGPSDRPQNGEINQVCTSDNTEDEASCDNESLTQNSITRILSSKFKDFKKYRENEKDEKTSNDPNSPQDKQKSPLLVSKRTRTAKPPPPAGKKRPDLIREESDLSDQLTTADKVGTVVETSNKPQKYVTIAMQDWYPGDGQGDTITSAQSSITRLLSKKFRGFRKYVVESEQFAPEERPEVLKPMKRLVTTYEGLDYEINENSLFQEYQNSLEYKNIQWQWLSRWIVMFLIGFCTALVAVGVEMSVDYIVHYKFLALQTLTDECTDSQTPGCLAIPLVVWVVINCFCVVLGSALVTYLEPMATGSGIPQVKCYLNGIKMPGLMTIRALLAKAVGVVMSICGGLACGKEGPMIHSGAIVAAGISQGRARRCGRRYDPRIFKFLRSDHERRDFVSAGAAAGVAAAFGAPIGGVLFSLEEGASFWNQMLTWRMLFASMTATFSVNIILSAIHGNAADLSNPGLVSFGQFTDITYDTIEFPIFILMAVFGGLTGALFVRMNYHLSIFRRKFVRKKWLKVLEAVVIAAVSAVTAYFLVYTWHGCKDSLEKKDIHDDMGVKLFCDYAEKNEFSVIFFKSPEGSLKGMLHDENFEPGTLALLAVYFYFLTCWTYGLSVSSGVFIPCLLTGAAWGRLVGQGLHRLIPHLVQANNVSKYALIGAACQLGGIVRMTISLTVIIIECTGDITFGLPIMFTLLITKWTADFFNAGIYDMHIMLGGLPFLSWEAPPLCYNVKARHVMARRVVTLNSLEKVGTMIDMLKDRKKRHSGFPVVEAIDGEKVKPKTYGKLIGFMLRSQLTYLLREKGLSFSNGVATPKPFSLQDFMDAKSRNLPVESMLTDEERECVLDLKPFMNPSPFSVAEIASLPKVFTLFRGLGLRHLIVVNDDNEVKGIITRKDLAKYRTIDKKGKLNVVELDMKEW
ncbi:H(+)/Cl(-) exchange transporter 7-like [Lingula anatina]|uniref:Chloride channel protein n=1 Tax=Lingula anatina TaxID=7574 RepID=A0A1S3IKU7_LINAN|nr:H(+)/Cl(-) exchange transporter 7-like [Lingula anatina]|eukprot:XP_013398870.1 H(+)/Cl(-) exchange transporter 7-like [Lingula anatina]